MQYASVPLTRRRLRIYARSIRRSLGLENELYFPIVDLLENLPNLFPDTGINYEIVEDDALPTNTHAQYDAKENVIRIKNSVYERACDGYGRDRMTIAHEIAHFLLLTYSGLTLSRDFGDTPVPVYQNPEWHAKCLAGELLIPKHLTALMHPYEVARRCGVSQVAAEYQSTK